MVTGRADRLDALRFEARRSSGRGSDHCLEHALWRVGLVRALYEQAARGEMPDAVAFHATTQDVNPSITAEFLAQEEARDPDSFRSEYMAEFVGSGDSSVDMSRVDLSGWPTARPEDARLPGLWSGSAFSRDPFGVALVGRTSDGVLVVGPSGRLTRRVISRGRLMRSRS